METTVQVLATRDKERLPYFAQPLGTTISNVIFHALAKGNPDSITLRVDDGDHSTEIKPGNCALVRPMLSHLVQSLSSTLLKQTEAI